MPSLSPNDTAPSVHRALWVAIILCFGCQTVKGEDTAALRAKRVEAVKAWVAERGKTPYPHGRMWYVDNQAPDASDDNDGTEAAPFETINRAAQLALPGDTVLVAKGIYREHVSPAHGGYDVNSMITYRAKQRRKVIIKGSVVWNAEWKKAKLEGVDDEVWTAQLDPSLVTSDFPVESFNPFHVPDQLYTGPKDLYKADRPTESTDFPKPVRGMIFMDGDHLPQARSLTDFITGTNIYYIAADGQTVFARFLDDSPQSHEFEVTVREQVFAPKTTGIAFVHVKGFVMEHGANAASWVQYGMVSPSSKGGTWHWIIEGNVIRWSNACGLDIGQGHWGPGRSTTRGAIDEEVGDRPDWSHWVRANDISDHGQAGIWAIGGASNSIVEYNRIERNGWHNTIHHVEAAGLKFHAATDVVIRGNLVRDNDCWGLWLDICGKNNRITQNLLINNMLAGVMIEGMWGHTLVDNNIAAFTRTHAFHQMNLGDGFYGHQSSHVTYAHNLAFANNGYGYRLLFWGKGQTNYFPDKKMRVSHNRVVNNIAYANGRGAIALPMTQTYCKDNISESNFCWGPSSLPLFELGRGIIGPHEMMATIDQSMRRAHASADQVPFLTEWKRGQMGPNVGDMRHYGPLVSLPVWQSAEGRDLRSVIGPLPLLWMTRAGQIQLRLTPPNAPRGRAPGEVAGVFGATPENYEGLDRVKCTPIAEIKHDYFGNRRPQDTPPTVGPFQDLNQLGLGKDSDTFIHLWPIDPTKQSPAQSLRLDRPLPELDEQEIESGKDENWKAIW